MLRLSGFELYSRWVPLIFAPDFPRSTTLYLLSNGIEGHNKEAYVRQIHG